MDTTPLLLTSRALTACGARHGFSTRVVDLSVASTGVEAARARVADALGATGIDLVSQVHGADVAEAGPDPFGAPVTADAIVAPRPRGRAIGIRVADCVPILAVDRRSGRVAAIHAGWRGLVAGVVGRAIDALAPSTDRSSIVAAIGPCICGACFEVGADVAGTIGGAVGDAVVVARHGDKAHVDLRLGVRLALVAAGIDHDVIDDVEGCTMHEPARFFSHRRDAAAAGRHLAAIVPL